MLKALSFAAIFFVTFGVLAARVSTPDLYDPPPGGDERDYEALAYNLWKGRGFGYFWSDPEWRAPYLSVPAAAGAVRDLESNYYPTTYRPPAFPALWALTYHVAGRDFGTIRFVNAALMAGAVTLAAAIALEFSGLAAAFVAAVVLIQIPDISVFARERLTEALATLLVALLAWMWVRSSTREPSVRTAVLSGAVLGLMILARSIFVIWLPAAMLMPAKPSLPGSTRRWVARACCVGACLLVVGPWWTRNIILTGAFLPTGTQGPINLTAGFSQRALDNEGRWRSNSGDGAKEIEDAGVDPYSVEYEVRLARHRSALAREWMWNHPREVVQLMGLHVWQEFRTRRARTDWTLLLPAFVVALLYFHRHPGVRSMLVLFAATLLSIALTWGVTGRFVVPLQPLAAAMASAMAVSIVMDLARLVRQRSVTPRKERQ